jgi:peptidoglycan/LPS O-acetylase OafA/YrhL
MVGGQNTKFQVDSLDGLRGFAALFVILSHTSNIGWFFIPGLDLSGSGKSGVFLFFVLSAYLLTIPLLKKGSNIFTFSYISYYLQRRVLRIVPLYFSYLLLALISTFAIDYLFGTKLWAIPFRLDLYEFFQHLLLLQGKSVTWSIAVEFKFYFVLPLIAIFSSLLFEKSHALVFAFLIMAIAYFWIAFPSSKFSAEDVRLGPFLPVFLLGVLAAVIQVTFERANSDIRRYDLAFNILCYIAFSILMLLTPALYSNVVEPVDRSYFSKDRIIFGVLWTVVLLTLVNGSSIIGKFFSTKPMRYLGTISFGCYLIHPPIIFLIRHFGLDSPLSAWFVLGATLLLSHVSYQYFEIRFISLNSKPK